MSSTDTGKASEWQTEEIQKEIHNTDYHKLYNTGSNEEQQNPDEDHKGARRACPYCNEWRCGQFSGSHADVQGRL